MTAITGTRPVRRARISTTAIVYIVLIGVIALSAVLVAAAGKSFFTTGTLTSVLTLMSILGFVAIGQTLVIISGSLDLSVPYVVSTASIVGAGIMAQGAAGIVPGVLAALLVSAAIGAANGLIVTKLRVHGFIATLGVGLIISGWLGTSFQGSFGSAPAEFRLIGATLIAGVPLSTIIMLVCAGLAALLLHRTRLGHHIYAVGGSAHVARLSGVRTQVPVVVSHILCSTLAGLAGLLLLARTSVGSPTIGSQGGYDLMSIAAVVLGGTLLAGGSGGVLGTIGGVAIFAVLDHVMGVLEVNPFFKDFVRGAVIILAVALYAWRSLQRRPPRFPGKGARS
ncbi:ABC transporter permease [Agrococcus baldri]|uniref:Ribose ABC transporter permease n=1 Tax=Agrococcus baldri TaxID=153730 RepID=A0AA87UXP4_9MICO|nr:ABC transporter permease [Agrococcus baldri]GEK80552.1 ribose ABC transporter permease [Agrococcus baldri]